MTHPLWVEPRCQTRRDEAKIYLLLMISIVVPMHNAEKWLARTIHSILLQSYPRWELILVENGSTDQSLAIAQKFATQDQRIQLIQMEQLGIMRAREAGYRAAQGKAILFCDSDDTLPPFALQHYNDAFCDGNPDLVIGQCQTKKLSGEWSSLSQISLSTHASSGELFHALLSKKLSHAVWGKLFNRRLFENHTYQNYDHFNRSEDGLLFYQIVRNVQHAVAIPHQVYEYYHHRSSITRKKLTPQVAKAAMTFWNYKHELFRENRELTLLSQKRFVEELSHFFIQGAWWPWFKTHSTIQELDLIFSLEQLKTLFSENEATDYHRMFVREMGKSYYRYKAQELYRTVRATLAAFKRRLLNKR